MSHTILITDLDNTLYNWVDYYGPAFRAMVHLIAQATGVEEDIIYNDFRRVYHEFGSIEHTFSIQELDLVKAMSKDILEALIHTARVAFGMIGRTKLKPYAGVLDTLSWAMNAGILVICSTNAPINLAEFHLRQLRLSRFFFGLVGRKPTCEIESIGYKASRIRKIWQISTDQ